MEKFFKFLEPFAFHVLLLGKYSSKMFIVCFKVFVNNCKEDLSLHLKLYSMDNH